MCQKISRIASFVTGLTGVLFVSSGARGTFFRATLGVAVITKQEDNRAEK